MNELYAAALLHDIGKFYMRTEDKDSKDKIKKEYKNIYAEENAFAPRHQEWGANFCENLNLENNNIIRNYIRNHHKPDNVHEKIISIADMLSAGERHPSDDDDCKNMYSILSIVKLDKEAKRKVKPLTKLSDFKGLLDEEEENLKQAYKNLWDEFNNIISGEKDIERIYYILKEYTSNIPSAYYYSSPDISLFSHLTTTGAIAVCLYKQFEEDIKIGNFDNINSLYTRVKDDKSKINDELFCLIKGDISGIQSFLYNIDMDGAVKSLKGRSFYLSYILDIIARYIVEKEGLTLSNILYCGGGHFYILAPEKSLKNIDKYREKVEKVFLKAHGIDVTVLLSCVKFEVSKLADSDFSEVFEKSGIELEKLKNKKFSKVLNNEFFKPVNQNHNVCPNCGRILKNDRCSFCESFNTLADKLNKSKYFNICKTDEYNGDIKTVDDIFKAFGFELLFSDYINKKAFAINKEDADFKNNMGYIKTAKYVYMGDDNKIANITQVADLSKGIKKWGLLRGDVDNLGRIFSDGLKGKTKKESNKSIARISTLSTELEIFFGYFLEEKIKNNYNACTVVYSGGDDFFILGPWNMLPDVAKSIRDEFSLFSGGNENLTISMAIEIAPDDKFPVYKVAQTCGESLDRAKEYKRYGYTKNSLSLFGKVIGWEEFDKLKEVKDTLSVILQKGVTRNLLNILYCACEQYKKSKEKEEIFKIWRFIYYISRIKERNSNAKFELSYLIDNILMKKNNEIYDKLQSAVSWADFETR
ncbi:type III-A CRISPR-associated protein Cas10/Csm1 [Caloramator sp. E03]|uniref:type III-A CRISPR-associated protein Cas10/Csm1 n=1 Tax=Caloramator sp. E03 TaxID=2576307 RepID=UPI00111028C3|nr:type III-A CRISPR-associated protein Cas10/Csm1 [Caloramator sp. E03]QCX34074.1 type III-A CRISPR-associated protein Cas10/Csm1 [Caloramator sp. E03]